MYGGTTYLHLNFAWVGIFQFGLVTLFILLSLFHSNDETSLSPVNTHNRTLYAKKNFKINNEGVKYVNYTDPETGKHIYANITFAWFDEILKGKYVPASFNGTNLKPRKIPFDEWLPSPFRSSQLKPWVQVPFRAAVLLSLTIRIAQNMVFGYHKLLKSSFYSLDISIMSAFMTNEILFNVCLFLISNFLISLDAGFLFLFDYVFVLAHITFSLKMLFSLWHLGSHVVTLFRLTLFILAIITFYPSYNSVMSYIHYNYCDQYTTMEAAAIEWLAVVGLWFSVFLDAMQGKNYQLLTITTKYEENDFRSVKQTLYIASLHSSSAKC